MKKLGRPKTGSYYRRKGDKRYIVAWYGSNGKRHTRRIDGTTVQEARDFLDARKNDTGRGISPDTDKVYLDTLERLVVADLEKNGCASVKRVRRAYFHLKEQLATVRALLIPPILDEYIAERRRTVKDGKGNVTKQGASAATVRQELRWLGRGYRLASEKGLLPYRPALPEIAVSNARQGFITEEQLVKLVAVLPEYLQSPTWWAYLTAWRKTEIFTLRWSSVDLENGVVRVEAEFSKNGKAREYQYEEMPELADLINAQRAATTAWERAHGAICPWVFHRGGKQIRYIYTDWRAAVQEAGLAVIFHDLRRSGVRQMELAGVARSTAMKLSGHLTEDTYKRYAISSNAEQRAGIAKIREFRAIRKSKTKTS